MSQLIAFKNSNGIVLAADSAVVEVDSSGNVRQYGIDRLIKLTAHTAIATGGAAAGENMGRKLKKFIDEEGVKGVEAVYNAAMPFLASAYQEFMRKTCEVLPLDPIHHVNFILAGYSEKNERNPFRLYLLWTKKKLPQLDGDEITSAFTVPRLIRLEHRLNQMSRDQAALDEVLGVVREGMEKQAEIDSEVAGPFHYVTITRDGVKSAT